MVFEYFQPRLYEGDFFDSLEKCFYEVNVCLYAKMSG